MTEDTKKNEINDEIDNGERNKTPLTRKGASIESLCSKDAGEADKNQSEDDKNEVKDDLSENIASEESKDDNEAVKRLTKEEIEEIIKKSLERDELLDKLQRTRAEYSNFQKRMIKEIETAKRFAIQGLVMELTSILGNFTRAILFSKESKNFEKLLEGIQLVEGQFFKTLEDYGVKAIETVGKPFDPVMHEAIMEEEDNSQPHHTVIMELERGFLLNDRVAMPAKVKVSKNTENKDEGNNEQVEDENKEVEEALDSNEKKR